MKSKYNYSYKEMGETFVKKTQFPLKYLNSHLTSLIKHFNESLTREKKKKRKKEKKE